MIVEISKVSVNITVSASVIKLNGNFVSKRTTYFSSLGTAKTSCKLPGSIICFVKRIVSYLIHCIQYAIKAISSNATRLLNITANILRSSLQSGCPLRNINISNGNGSISFLRITTGVHVGLELLALPEHPRSPSIFSGVRVSRSLVYFVMSFR
jgi:hypothetical protein